MAVGEVRKEGREHGRSEGIIECRKGAYSDVCLSAESTGFGEAVEEKVGEAGVDWFAVSENVFAAAHCGSLTGRDRDGKLEGWDG